MDTVQYPDRVLIVQKLMIRCSWLMHAVLRAPAPGKRERYPKIYEENQQLPMEVTAREERFTEHSEGTVMGAYDLRECIRCSFGIEPLSVHDERRRSGNFVLFRNRVVSLMQ